MARPDFYPPAPEGVPSDYTKPTGEYRLKTLAVLLSLFCFLLFYILLIVGVIALAFYVISLFTSIEPDRGRGSARASGMLIVMMIGAVVALFMLVIFLVKGLFKSQDKDREHYLELERGKHPKLFEFIERICAETQAPRPAAVYLSPDVNAAVFSKTSLINLIIPPKKNLLIGAGLVSTLDLREFKAVIAHEFGHFSQKSMSLGTYVYVANRVLSDMIYSRDKWDDLLDTWAALDLRISFPAWFLKGAVWCLRKMLGGIFQGINLLNMSLSRQMEFNADDVAVSVAGSDAIVTTLCKIEFADHCFHQAASDLMAAVDHDLYTDDLFHHQRLSADFLRKKAKKPELGIPPEPPAKVFADDDDRGVPAMWASHPPNHEREENAKRTYFPAEPDHRSPWILFENPEKLRSRLSMLFYVLTLDKKKHKKIELSESTTVQKFIDDERRETSYDPKYHGLFDERILRLSVGDLDNVQTGTHRTPPVMVAFFKNFPPRELESFMAEHNKRQGESALLNGLESGELSLKNKTFEFRKQEKKLSEVPRLIKKVQGELDQDYEQLQSWDRAMYDVHYLAAKELDADRANDLKRRYRFQLTVQKWIVELNQLISEVEFMLGQISGSRQLSEGDFRTVRKSLVKAGNRLWDCLVDAKKISCPEMASIPEGTLMSEIIKTKEVKNAYFEDDTISGEEIGLLLQGCHTTLDRLRRLYFKGLGKILGLQEEIATDYAMHASAE